MGQALSQPWKPLASLKSLEAHSHGYSSEEERRPLAWAGGSVEHSQDLYKNRHYVIPRQKQNLYIWCIIVAFNKKDKEKKTLAGKKKILTWLHY